MGNCISSNKKARDMGISSTPIINNKKVNRFHEGDQATGLSSSRNNARNAKVLRRPKKKIHKGLIGLPGNFQHTGHIGIADMRSGKVDPEKIRSAMSEITGAINLEIMGSIPTQTTSTSENKLTTSEEPDSSSVSSSQTLQNKSTIQSIAASNPQSSQMSSSQPSSPSSPILSDPMAEIVAALKMPADGNFDLFDKKDSTTTVA